MEAMAAMQSTAFLLNFKHSAPAPVAEPAALHPLTYLPFHLLSHHLVARVFPNKAITYPAHLAFALTQYVIEHFIEEVPTLAAANGALVAAAIFLITPYYYYRAFKHTRSSKSLVWAGLAVFLVALPVFKGLDQGFPKDDPVEQAAANRDQAHSYWHLLIHAILLVNGALVSYGVPWNSDAPQTLKANGADGANVGVPASPAHSTLSPLRRRTAEQGCSPTKWPTRVKGA